MSDERALSNTLGYVILFSIVLLSITLTATFGVGGLTDARDGTIRTNAQQSMQTLGSAADDLRESNTTIRESAFRTSSGTLGYGEKTTVTVSNSSHKWLNTTFRPIVYRFDGTTMAYEAGAVIESSDGSGNAAMVEEPPFVLDSNTIILPVTSTEPVAQGEVSGGIVTTQLLRESSTLNYTGSGRQNINITIQTTPERAAAWQQTIQSEPGVGSGDCGDSDISEGIVMCKWMTNSNSRIIVREFHISYEYAT